MEQAKNDCASFLGENEKLLEGVDPEQAGHDFWLTRNRHGTGFWDKPEIYGSNADPLTARANARNELSLFAADGLVYFE
jgi:hypothetical protein